LQFGSLGPKNLVNLTRLSAKYKDTSCPGSVEERFHSLSSGGGGSSSSNNSSSNSSNISSSISISRSRSSSIVVVEVAVL